MVSKPDQIFPIFVMQVMGDIPCIPGLFVAGVFSGALSTVSSGLNSLAAVVLQDMFISACNMKFDEKKKTIITKSLAVGFGILSYVFVFMVKYLPGVLEVNSKYFQAMNLKIMYCRNVYYIFKLFRLHWEFLALLEVLCWVDSL